MIGDATASGNRIWGRGVGVWRESRKGIEKNGKIIFFFLLMLKLFATCHGEEAAPADFD